MFLYGENSTDIRRKWGKNGHMKGYMKGGKNGCMNGKYGYMNGKCGYMKGCMKGKKEAKMVA